MGLSADVAKLIEQPHALALSYYNTHVNHHTVGRHRTHNRGTFQPPPPRKEATTLWSSVYNHISTPLHHDGHLSAHTRCDTQVPPKLDGAGRDCRTRYSTGMSVLPCQYAVISMDSCGCSARPMFKYWHTCGSVLDMPPVCCVLMPHGVTNTAMGAGADLPSGWTRPPHNRSSQAPHCQRANVVA